MPSLLTTKEQEQWKAGKYCRMHQKLGTQISKEQVRFAVWAPHAKEVSVVGDFNGWDASRHTMQKEEITGIWSAIVSGAKAGQFYKFAITPKGKSTPFLKADPLGFSFEVRPKNASQIYDVGGFKWTDDAWIESRARKQAHDQPISIYEVHAGSWKRKDGAFLSYRELAAELIPYVTEMGFTHLELMPICEHPYDPSWGYQVTGFFAPTSRYGDPKDVMHFIDACHKAGLGVIMDWVPGHFPKDEHGLNLFDGTALYEHEHPLRNEQKDWGTKVFDYDKPEVRSFLISSAVFWCEKYHVDALRIDAVASMLYLDYSKKEGEWIPNKEGGKEHLEAIKFLKDLNETIHRKFPGVLTFAEESSAWPGVTAAVEKCGLGFDYKWNMGWMNDTLSYIEMNAKTRAKNPEKITFPMAFARDEQFVLPLSHDEVVHLKKPLLKKSPGNKSEKMATLRLLYLYMFGHPGKKLLFMGDEFGETHEWDENRGLHWELLNQRSHSGIQKLVKDLLARYKKEGALFHSDNNTQNFEWIDMAEIAESVFSFKRSTTKEDAALFFMLNFSDKNINDYCPKELQSAPLEVIINSDSKHYGGKNISNLQTARQGLNVVLAPYSGLILSGLSKKEHI